MFGAVYFGEVAIGGTSEQASGIVSVWSLGERTIAFTGMAEKSLEFDTGNSSTVSFTTMPEKTVAFALKVETRNVTFTRNH